MNILQKSKARYEKNLRRHEALIQSAIKVFGRKNYSAATTAEIAKEAGISEATIYKHFESKEVLYIECFQEVTRNIVGLYSNAYGKAKDDPLGAIEEIALNFLHYIYDEEDEPKFLGNMVADLYDPRIKAVFKEFLERSIDVVERIIVRAQQMGRVDEEQNARVLAWVFVGQFHNVILAKELGLFEGLNKEQYIRDFIKPVIER